MTGHLKADWLVRLLVIFVLCPLYPASDLSAFNLGMHELLNDQVVDVSTLDRYLKEELGFVKGLAEPVNGEKVRRWIQIGGRLEDQAWSLELPGALLRSTNHFHNPLRPWDQAGLNAVRLLCPPWWLRGEASVRWAQDPHQGMSGQAAWTDARQSYRDALIQPAKTDRDAAFARMFQLLGQQLHLVADLAVPAHTRNDPHCPFPDGLEDWTSRNTTLVQGLLGERPLPPDSAVFSLGVPISDPIAKVPIARLWDTDQYGKSNPAITLSSTIGLAEYTNANFFSDHTVYATDDFPFPAPTSVELGLPEPEPKKGELRRYFKKVGDGEPIDHLAVPSALYEFLPAALQDREKGLDDKVFQDYASKLLPRAVGYSAALLDYFFRGKLDVELVGDAADPSLFRLTGTNASTEPLVAGTLTLFAEDSNGLRGSALALDPTEVRDISPGQSLTSARFQAPENAERFIAVYQGTLGQEVKPDDPTLPGAVIGKVLGGVRVEEIFSDGTRWKVRTPRGVYLLPLTVGEFQNVKWGDTDNLLLAQTPFGPNRPNRFVVYEAQRQPDSVEFSTVTTPDGTTVELSKKRETMFPMGLSLDRTVQLTWNIHYRQLLGRYTRTLISRWTPYDPRWPDDGWYKNEAPQLGPLTIETARDQTVPFNLGFDLRLDLDHNFNLGWPSGEGYGWRLEDVAVDASGRVLAVVFVFLTSTQSLTVDFPHFVVNAQGTTEIAWHDTGRPPIVYGGNLVWAIVDISEPAAPRIVASTADPGITLSYQGRADTFEGVWVHAFARYEGGPQAGLYDQGWSKASLQNPTTLTPITDRVEVSLQRGDQAIALEGRLKEELRAELGQRYSLSFQLGETQGAYEQVYDCASASSCSAIRFLVTTTDLAAYPVILFRGTRTRPAPGGERLVFLGYDEALDQTGVLVWEPGSSQARVVSQLQEDWHILGSATPASVLVSSRFSSSRAWSSSLISLEGTQPVSVFPNVRLTDSFMLIEPSWLYNRTDGKFYAPQPPLRRTALPAKLAEVYGNPVGDYHAIRLP